VTARVRTMFGCEKTRIRREETLYFIVGSKIGNKSVIFVATVV
jgi:hypothetical protein